VALVAGPSEAGVAEEARTRGFAAPAFAGCAVVEGINGGTHYSMRRYRCGQDLACWIVRADPLLC
jgi:hypothetical protein